ncbi:MAG: hypothetical protein ABL907_07790 [Hyphomicrobium sp.]
MSLVKVYSTLDIAEALVIRSSLDAHGIYATLVGLEMAQQVPIGSPPINTITVGVSDVDAAAAHEIIATARAQP